MAPNDDRVKILVNSSDGFEDCWGIFLKFLEIYWPDCAFDILINTEKKSQNFSDQSIRCSQVAIGEERRLTWSECLLRALDQIEAPLTLYFQEDYFIDHPVRSDIVDQAVELMIANPEISHVALTKHASHGPYIASQYPGFKTISQNARYRISTQAGLWRGSVLRSYLHPKENGWMFEILGTRRAQRREDIFLIADFAPEKGGPAIDYIHTGIIKGRWHPRMPDLFKNHGVAVDMSKRGIYQQPGAIRRKMEVIKKLLSDPRHLLSELLWK